MKVTVALPDCTEIELEVPEGERYSGLVDRVQKYYKDDIILMRLDGKLLELNKKVKNNSRVSFVTTGESAGHRAYNRSVIMLLQCAAKKRYGSSVRLQVLFTQSNGYYCKLYGKNQACCPCTEERSADTLALMELNESDLEHLRTYMQVMVEQNLRISKQDVSTKKAEAMFAELGYHDKARLLHYRRSSRTNLYELSGYSNYFYGYMADSTGKLKYFDLELHDSGFFLLLPSIENTRNVAPHQHSFKLFHTVENARSWSRSLGIGTIGNLNDAIARGRGKEMILLQEAMMEAQIGEIAAKAASDEKKKFIMVAGPSSSGKTSFANRLSIQLIAKGLKPHLISLDDYYKNRNDCPRNPDGSFDFECLEALDVEQFNSDMTRLLNGEEVEMPNYNFKTGLREYRGSRLKLQKNEVLVIEGIHGLNDNLSYSLPAESKFKIYISALTQVNIDEHNPLSTTDVRLIRRMVRDNRTRNTSAKETIAMWPSVRKGENLYIFPYQESADIMFNSALVYELAVLKVYAEPLLFQIDQGEPEYEEAQRLLKFLDYILPLPTEGINTNSLMREFVGGSCFQV